MHFDDHLGHSQSQTTGCGGAPFQCERSNPHKKGYLQETESLSKK